MRLASRELYMPAVVNLCIAIMETGLAMLNLIHSSRKVRGGGVALNATPSVRKAERQMKAQIRRIKLLKEISKEIEPPKEKEILLLKTRFIIELDLGIFASIFIMEHKETFSPIQS